MTSTESLLILHASLLPHLSHRLVSCAYAIPNIATHPMLKLLQRGKKNKFQNEFGRRTWIPSCGAAAAPDGREGREGGRERDENPEKLLRYAIAIRPNYLCPSASPRPLITAGCSVPMLANLCHFKYGKFLFRVPSPLKFYSCNAGKVAHAHIHKIAGFLKPCCWEGTV